MTLKWFNSLYFEFYTILIESSRAYSALETADDCVDILLETAEDILVDALLRPIVEKPKYALAFSEAYFLRCFLLP